MQTITIVGQGFTGSVMSIVCSRVKKKSKFLYNVFGLEKKSKNGTRIIRKLKNGEFPFENNDTFLKSELKKVSKQKNFFPTTNNDCIKNSDIVLVNINLDVIDKNTREKDLKNFQDTIINISENIKKNSLIIIESTIPPGYCQKVIQPLINNSLRKRNFGSNDIVLGHSYERVTPGKDYLNSVIKAPRVYSSDSNLGAKKTKNFLESIIDVKKYPLTQLHNTIASETSKILENTYRAVNIAFIHEWLLFADKAKINLFEIINAIKKRKTHANIRYPGLGVGGYCLTKDPLYGDYSKSKILNFEKLKFPFSELAIKTNNSMPNYTINVIKNSLKKLDNKKIILYGVAYKNDVADTRQSPSKNIYDFLKKKNCKIICLDPLVRYWREKNIKVGKLLHKFPKADAIIFCVPHYQIRNISYKSFVNNKIFILDSNNCLSDTQKKDLKMNNFNIKVIGDGTL